MLNKNGDVLNVRQLRTFPPTNYKFREQLEAVITRPRVAGITHAPSPPEHAARGVNVKSSV